MFVPEKDFVFKKCMDHRDLSFLPEKTDNSRNRESHSAREILLYLGVNTESLRFGKKWKT